MGCGKGCFGKKGQKSHLKLKILVSKFVPWDLEATCTWDLKASRDRTSRQPAHGPRGNPLWDLEASRADLEAGRNDPCRLRCIVTFIAVLQFFSRVSFQMYPQMACPSRCIVALVAFVWFFTWVNFQMFPQIACPNRCIITLVAFVRFFSRVSFQMSPQIACLRRRIITLVAFVWLFSAVFSNVSPNRLPRRMHSALIAFVWLFSTVCFKMYL